MMEEVTSILKFFWQPLFSNLRSFLIFKVKKPLKLELLQPSEATTFNSAQSDSSSRSTHRDYIFKLKVTITEDY